MSASLTPSCLNRDGYLDGWHLNDTDWMASDYTVRCKGREIEAL